MAAGDRVALVMPSCPQHVVAFYAVLRLGAVVVEHNPLYTRGELAHQLADSGATVAVVWDKTVPTVVSARGGTSLRHVVAVDVTTALPRAKRLALRLPLPSARATRTALTAPAPGVPRWDDLLAAAAPLPAEVPGPAGEDTALLQYTGGTTGTPKGAVLSHRNLRANAAQGRAWVPGLRDGAEVVYGVLPLFHAYGVTLCLTFAVQIGATLVLFPRFDVDQVLAAVRRRPPTFLPAVPPVYQRLAEAARARGADLTSVRYGISGAMALPPEVVTAWEEVSGGLLVEGYGMTESSPITLGNPVSEKRRPGTVGVPFPSTDVRVVDPDDPTTDVPAGSPGGAPGARAAGVLRLLAAPRGDRGGPARGRLAAHRRHRRDVRGRVRHRGGPDQGAHHHGRVQRVPLGGGGRPAPGRRRRRRRRGRAARRRRDRAGRRRGRRREGATPDPEAVRSAVRAHLAGYKVPRRVVVVDELPRSVIGKVLRREVRDRLQG